MSDAAKLLMELGFDVSSKAGRQLVYCIELAANDPTLTDSIVKILYPMVADNFRVTASATERIILRELRKVADAPGFRDKLKAFETRHGCEGLFSNSEHQTLKPFIRKMAYILNSEESSENEVPY